MLNQEILERGGVCVPLRAEIEIRNTAVQFFVVVLIYSFCNPAAFTVCRQLFTEQTLVQQSTGCFF